MSATIGAAAAHGGATTDAATIADVTVGAAPTPRIGGTIGGMTTAGATGATTAGVVAAAGAMTHARPRGDEGDVTIHANGSGGGRGTVMCPKMARGRPMLLTRRLPPLVLSRLLRRRHQMASTRHRFDEVECAQ